MVAITLTSKAPHFSQEHVLFNKHYILEFEWIEQESYWVLHLYDSRENPIALGLKVSTEGYIWADAVSNIVLLLIAKQPNAVLNLANLHKDFMLVAYEAV